MDQKKKGVHYYVDLPNGEGIGVTSEALKNLDMSKVGQPIQEPTPEQQQETLAQLKALRESARARLDSNKVTTPKDNPQNSSKNLRPAYLTYEDLQEDEDMAMAAIDRGCQRRIEKLAAEKQIQAEKNLRPAWLTGSDLQEDEDMAGEVLRKAAEEYKSQKAQQQSRPDSEK